MEALELDKPIKNIKVLMYHRVLSQKPESNAKWHYVTQETFEKHMSWLDRLGYTGITFADYLLYQQGKLTLPKKSIIITFDDGYRDVFENALPILQKYEMSAVLFVLGNRRLQKAEWDGEGGEPPCYLMDDDQIREADALGLEIGAHSMNHIDLVGSSFEELKYEINRSKSKIESILEKPLLSFAYPYGRVDDRAQKIVLDSGYQFACGVYTGPPRFWGNRLDVRRIAINHTTNTLGFLLRVLTPFQYMQWYYSVIKDFMIKIAELLPSRKVNKVPIGQSVNKVNF